MIEEDFVLTKKQGLFIFNNEKNKVLSLFREVKVSI